MKRRLAASVPLRASLQELQRVLVDPPVTVLAPERASGRGSGRYLSSLSVDVSAGSAVHHLVHVTLGPGATTARGSAWSIAWAPAGGKRLVPSFQGTLEATPEPGGTNLTLTGQYEPPLGVVGAFGDGLIAHRIACRSVASFVVDLAARIDEEADRQRASRSPLPAPYPPDLRDDRTCGGHRRMRDGRLDMTEAAVSAEPRGPR